MKPQTVVKSFVSHHYGNLLSSAPPIFDEKTRIWIAEIKSDYPIVLQDDREPERKIVRFMSVHRIGRIIFDENLKFREKESTTREECTKVVESLLTMWRDRAEKIVVQASADYLIRISEFRHFFTPIEEVVDYLLEHDAIYDEELMQHRSIGKQTKTSKYLNLLEGLDLIRRIDDGYENADLWLFLREKCEENGEFDEDKFKRAILSEVIRKRYSALREVFEISRLQPTIHINNCIYKPSLEAEHLIYLTENSIVKNYKELYGRINPLTVTHILRNLRTVHAIDRRENYWSGTDELLSTMVSIKNEMPELAPPLTSH
jgi:hypothetical protein